MASVKLEEQCSNCKYYGELKISKREIQSLGGGHFGIKKRGSDFAKTNCCLMFVKTESEPYVLEVEPNDMCEMFSPKEVHYGEC